MFGWEFPPYSSGGLGTACHGITQGLSNEGVQVTFVVPTLPSDLKSPYATVLSAEDFMPSGVNIRKIKGLITPYMTDEDYLLMKRMALRSGKTMYGSNLFEEVIRYSERAKTIAKRLDYDVIHAHDWMTYPAGIKAKKASGKPLVVHVHATEFDRSGQNPNPHVYKIERAGLNFADKIIAVSQYTKDMLITHYGVPPGKIAVVHNAVETSLTNRSARLGRTVLFLGRMTLQKGPDYFVRAAKKVLQFEPDTRFIMAGAGDMEPQIINQVIAEGLSDKFIFTGFIDNKLTSDIYSMASVYVMPSVSEPFGISALEAIQSGTPVVVSKQSGVREIMPHCLTVDFWDIDAMTNMIVGLLRHRPLRDTLSDNASHELKSISWGNSARKCIDVYNEVLAKA